MPEVRVVVGRGRGEREITEGHKETFEGDGCVCYYLYFGNSFTGVYIC